MASSSLLHSFCSLSLHSPTCFRSQAPALTQSQFLSSNSFVTLKRQSLLSNLQIKKLGTRKSRSRLLVFAAQSNLFKVLQTVWKAGRDGIEAATSFVPDSVPRPIARISTTVVVLSVTLFVLKSFLSTAFFVLATMGLVYFTFIALNKDEGPGGDGGDGGGTTTTEDTLEEARRIMEKYK